MSTLRVRPTWLDRVVMQFSPAAGVRRIRNRAALALMERHFEATTAGRRTGTWSKPASDANAAIGPALAGLRQNARDLVRNNPYAESALATIADHTIGWGITAKPAKPNAKLLALWRSWAETTACDADGRENLYGLQQLAMRTVVESGEVIVRLRRRFLEDGYPVPLQIQVLDPDYLDSSKDTLTTAPPARGRVIQGVAFDALGKRIGYYLFPEHPGSSLGMQSSTLVPAESVLHIYWRKRPGQVRGYPWFAPIVLRMRDFDAFEDATLMKQKIAACLSVITSDPDGSATALGAADDSADPPIDLLEPGAILNVPPGRSVNVVNPPTTGDYEAYSKGQLRAVATGMGIPYEDLTGDYTGMPFSAARRSGLRHESRVRNWRYNLIIPQFCDPTWGWFMQAAAILGIGSADDRAEWTPPPLPVVDPSIETLADQRRIRSGLASWSETVRERGYDPKDLLDEIKADFDKFKAAGLILDIDPANMTQAGQLQGVAAAEAKADTPDPLAAAHAAGEGAAA
jgi:lambda family phage portal protein